MGHLEPEGSRLGRIPELKWLEKIIMERALTRGAVLLAGGARSDYYIDKFKLFSDPAILRRIARLFAPIVSDVNPDLIAGTELGGVILATAVSQMANIPMIVVRKQPKAYGAFAQEYVEGPYEPGQRVLLLEDIVSNGREVMAARARLEELNLTVTIHAVINRGLAPVKSLVQFSLPRSSAKTEN
jgi:orotate phosphoribosyltransferase